MEVQKSIQSNARIIAATNKNLHDMVKNGTFREDLYYRLTTFPLTVPPLRLRDNDILIIADYLLKKYCKEFNKEEKKFTDSGSVALKKYHWPGNVRELQNVISRIVLIESKTKLSEAEISPYFESQENKESQMELSFLAEYSEKELLKNTRK